MPTDLSVVAVATHTIIGENGEAVVHEMESQPSEWVRFSPPPRPTTVESFSITGEELELKFEWNHRRDYLYGHDAYRIYRRLPVLSTPYQLLAEITSVDGPYHTGTMLTHTVLLDTTDNDLTYEYAITAVNGENK